MEITIRPIQASDNETLASIIRSSIEAFNLPTEGTAHSDPTTDNLFQHFQKDNSFYWVALEGDKVLGGCGVYPSKGLPAGCCELVRYFLAPEARGKGIGKTLLDQSVATAKELGYETMYLESFPDMKEAIRIYEQNGFEYLDHALGNTGHFACNVWMKMSL
ncbi:MAG: GNAT family N-acetyltransferase [Bacteroidota bacterium]